MEFFCHMVGFRVAGHIYLKIFDNKENDVTNETVLEKLLNIRSVT